MGYSLAEEFIRRGFAVCLVTGPVDLVPPVAAETVEVETASEMLKEIKKRINDCDAIIMSAAVCDFRPRQRRASKIKKEDELELRLVRNPDILKEIGIREDLVKVGFALETANGLKSARKKLKDKGLDLVVLNELKEGSEPFGAGICAYTLISGRGAEKNIKPAGKKRISGIIAGEVQKLMEKGKAQ
jgi:phosphopantothenoylcysteine decarboxylase / phosphopantothenate---cysteine ligase